MPYYLCLCTYCHLNSYLLEVGLTPITDTVTECGKSSFFHSFQQRDANNYVATQISIDN